MRTKLSILADIQIELDRLINTMNKVTDLLDTPTKEETMMLEEAATLVFRAWEKLNQATYKGKMQKAQYYENN